MKRVTIYNEWQCEITAYANKIDVPVDQADVPHARTAATFSESCGIETSTGVRVEMLCRTKEKQKLIKPFSSFSYPTSTPPSPAHTRLPPLSLSLNFRCVRSRLNVLCF